MPEEADWPMRPMRREPKRKSHRADLWLADRNIHLNLQDQFVHPRGKVNAFAGFAGHALDEAWRRSPSSVSRAC